MLLHKERPFYVACMHILFFLSTEKPCNMSWTSVSKMSLGVFCKHPEFLIVTDVLVHVHDLSVCFKVEASVIFNVCYTVQEGQKVVSDIFTSDFNVRSHCVVYRKGDTITESVFIQK